MKLRRETSGKLLRAIHPMPRNRIDAAAMPAASLKTMIREHERRALGHAVAMAGGNVAAVARRLGVGHEALAGRLAILGLDRLG